MTRAPQLNPYQTLPTHCFWNPSVGRIDPIDVDPMVSPRFTIGRDDRVATAGSCFAQHIARRLQANGYNYFIPERPHPIVSEEVARELNYGTFSARYGNLYTPRHEIAPECPGHDLPLPQGLGVVLCL